jgi:hypothetical protein
LIVQQADNTGLLGGVQRPNIVPGADLSTPGSYEDRLASADHPTATWLNPAAIAAAPVFTIGTGPRMITDLRMPTQQSVDVSFGKNVRLGGSRVGQVKLEIFNLLNRVTARGFTTNAAAAGTSSLGQINRQSGFMRLTQVMFRLNF